MAWAFHYLAGVLLLALASTSLTNGASIETPNPILVDEKLRSDGGFHVVLSDGHIHEPVKSFEEINPTHVNGEELFESDIMLTPEQRAALRQRKAIISTLNYRWPVGSDGYPHVPYKFSDTSVDQSAVSAGIQHWEQHTCIKFDAVSNEDEPHLKFIRDSGCYSYIGRIWYWAGQEISIGTGCTGLGTVTHEIGHATGFYHEQSRSDRDGYLVINSGNIQSGREGNFDKATDSQVSNYSVPYDYSSVMHYGGNYFTKNGHLTIATINPLAQTLIGSRAGLSHRDKLLANRMYPCIEKWLSNCGLTADPCQNDGYTGASCSCVCPPGTSGTNCQTITGDYYDALTSSCSEIITTETTVTSPNYPSNYPTGSECVKWIVAPECHTVNLTFSTFRLYDQTTCSDGSACCRWEGLEIRTSNLYDGLWYCGQMISSGTTFTSTNNQMILNFITFTNYYQGYSADVQFVTDTSCTPTGATTTTTPASTTTTTTPTTTTTTPTTTTTTPTTTTTTPTTTTTTPTTTTTTPTTTTTTPTTTTTTPTTTTTTPTTTTTTPTTTTTTPTTTTTTPTTTTTTTPTTTTTTPTTTTTTPTTTTTTPTTTTTTTTLTTDTTTPTTTTTPSNSATCTVESYGGKYYWTSPNFGMENYPNDFLCDIFASSTQPAWTLLTFQPLQLQGKVNRECKDSVSVTYPYDVTKTFCGTKRGKKVKLPSFHFEAEFISDDAINNIGFNISIESKTSVCHKIISLTTLGETGTFKTPRYPLADKKKRRMCELWFQAPTNFRVQLDFLGFNLQNPCKTNNVVINLEGDRSIPSATSSRYCGTTLPPQMTSDGPEIDLIYQANMKNKGFKVKYTVVE